MLWLKKIGIVAGTIWSLPQTIVALALLKIDNCEYLFSQDGGHFFVSRPKGFVRRLLERHGMAAYTLGVIVVLKHSGYVRFIRLKNHELRHVRQYMVFGAFLTPLYWLGSIYARLHGRHPYYENPFEKDARAHETPNAR